MVATSRSSASISPMPKRLGSPPRWSWPRVEDTNMSEGKALPAGRDDARRKGRCDSDLDGGSHVRDVHISAALEPLRSRHDGDHPRQRRRPVPRAKAAQSWAEKHARNRSTIRPAAFSSRGACGCISSNLSQRGIKVCLVEQLTAVNLVVPDHQKFDHSPFGSEAFCRRPIRRVGDDCSEAAEPMHGFDVHLEVWRDVPRATDVRDLISRLEGSTHPVVDRQPIRRPSGVVRAYSVERT